MLFLRILIPVELAPGRCLISLLRSPRDIVIFKLQRFYQDTPREDRSGSAVPGTWWMPSVWAWSSWGRDGFRRAGVGSVRSLAWSAFSSCARLSALGSGSRSLRLSTSFHPPVLCAFRVAFRGFIRMCSCSLVRALLRHVRTFLFLPWPLIFPFAP